MQDLKPYFARFIHKLVLNWGNKYIDNYNFDRIISQILKPARISAKDEKGSSTCRSAFRIGHHNSETHVVCKHL